MKHRRIINRIFFTTTALCLWAAGFGGCTEKPKRVKFYQASDADICYISRVVFVEMSQNEGFPEISSQMTAALKEAMLQKGLFRVDIIPQTHPDLRDLDMSKREPYTITELASIRKSLRCDAILFGKMVSYKPYPATQIGLFLRLIDLKDGKLVWAVDEIWDTTNRQTVRRIKNFYFDHMRDTYDPARSEMGIMSTVGFQKFVAYEVTETMDPAYRGESWAKTYFERPLRRLGRRNKKTTEDVIDDF